MHIFRDKNMKVPGLPPVPVSRFSVLTILRVLLVDYYECFDLGIIFHP